MDKPVEDKERLEEVLIRDGKAAPATGRLRGRGVVWAGAALLGVALVAVVWWLASGTNGIRYVTEPVTRGNLTVIVTATGSVQPTNKVDVSSELSGTVRRVLVDYNSEVTTGQVLAELDTDKLQATVNSSRAKVAAAKAAVVNAEATVTVSALDIARKKRLAAVQGVAAQDVEQAQATYDRAVAAVASARADVDVAEANLQLDETNLAKASIRSPINGVVLTRNVDPGQTVASSFQAPVLFSIAEDLKAMELQVDVDEADVGQVKIGQRATFTVDAYPDRTFPATISDVRFASEVIQGVVTYKAVLEIDNSELLLRPGMTATAEIRVTEVRDALLVPNTALRYVPVAPDAANRSFLRRLLPGPPLFRPPAPREETGRNRTVWRLRDGVPTEAPIVVGVSDGKHTEVQSGDLQPGQPVIVDQTAAKP